MSDQTLREQLEAAFDDATEAYETQTAGESPAEAEATSAEEAVEAPVDAPTEGAPAERAAEAGEVPEPTADAAVSEDAPEPEEAQAADRAPEGWKPAVREHWGDLPDPVKAEIQRREADNAKIAEESAEARRTASEWKALLDPYAPLIAAHNAPSAQAAVKGLMDTAAVLQTGTPQQKADRLAQLALHYDIDVRILDQALGARLDGHEPTPAALDPALEARLKPLEQLTETLNQNLQRAQEQAASQVDQTLAEFNATHEFANDVRLEMADLMELAARRGRSMTLEEAYDAACRLNPEISAVMTQRAQQSQVQSQQQRASAKRALADRMPGTSTQVNGSVPARSTGNLRQDLLAAIEDVEGGPGL